MQYAIKAIGPVSSEAGASMRAWQIIAASAVVASIAVAALFLPGVVRSPDGAASLFRTYWSGAVIVWLAAYSIVALGLSTAAAVRDFGAAEAGPAEMDWARRYLTQLGIAQYFSAVLALFALGLLPLTVVTGPLFPMPAAIGPTPAQTACAIAVLTGVLGWFIVTVVATFRAPPVEASSPAGVDTQSLREIIDLLRARPAEPVPVSAEIVDQLRHRDHSTLEAIKELAAAMSRIRNGIFEIQQVLQQRASEQAGQSGSAAPVDAKAVGELRTATASLTSAVAKLENIANGLAAMPVIGLSSPARGNVPPGSRSQLTTELQELLRDMASGSASPQEGSR